MSEAICMPPWLIAVLVSGPSALAGLGGLLAEPPDTELHSDR